MAAAIRKPNYRQLARVRDKAFYTTASPSLLAETPATANDNRGPLADVRDWETIFDHCEQSVASFNAWRLSTWTTWGQIARYLAPWRFYAFVVGNTYSEGLRKDFNVVDRTGTLCGETCSAGLMAGLTDPDREWLKLGPALPGLELDRQGAAYYEDMTERLNYVYDHSNFYEAQAQHYDDLVFFGTSPVIDYESDESILQCFVPCAGEYWLGVGMNNTDEVLAREFRQTVRQSVEMFGLENLPDDIRGMWRQKGGALDYETIIGHIIEPNFGLGDDGDVGRVGGGFTWREVYWLRGKKDKRPLSMSGFRDCPFAVSRWDTQGNAAYGRGVGEKLLPDTIQLQLETRQKAESIEKVNRPPMVGDVRLKNEPASVNPGKITWVNTADGKPMFYPAFQIAPDIPAITKDIEILQERLSRTAYNYAFQPVSDLRQRMKEQVTAAEIDKLTMEQLIPLGPVIGRVYGSLRKRIPRHLAIMQRKGLLPKKPQSLKGVPLRVDFVSMLTEARRATQTAAIARTMQFTGSLVGAWPEARFSVDPDTAVREFGDGVGASSKIFRSPRQIKQMVEAEAQQKKQAAAMQMTKEGALAAGALSKTSLAPNNALSALVGTQT